MLALVFAVKVATMPFPLGVWGAERIVLGKVSSIETVEGIRVATLEVERTLKGVPAQRIKFVACPAWTCDTSHAALGERGLYLLSPLHFTGKFGSFPDFTNLAATPEPPLELYNSGRGRFVFEKERISPRAWEYCWSMTPSMKRFLDLPRKKSFSEANMTRYVAQVLKVKPRSRECFR